MKPIFFMHIPKTGGTSLHHALSKIYGPSVFYPPLATEYQKMRFGGNFEAFNQLLAGLSEPDKSKLLRELNEQMFIGGHTHAGLLNVAASRRFSITCLRDPIDRLVSYYFHAVRPDSAKRFRRYGSETKGMNFY